MPEKREAPQGEAHRFGPIRLGEKPSGPADAELLRVVKRGTEYYALERARELIERYGAKPDYSDINSSRAIHYAAGLGNEERAKAFVELLLNRGASAGPRNNDGEKPADIARRLGRKKLLSLLQIAEEMEKA